MKSFGNCLCADKNIKITLFKICNGLFPYFFLCCCIHVSSTYTCVRKKSLKNFYNLLCSDATFIETTAICFACGALCREWYCISTIMTAEISFFVQCKAYRAGFACWYIVARTALNKKAVPASIEKYYSLFFFYQAICNCFLKFGADPKILTFVFVGKQYSLYFWE